MAKPSLNPDKAQQGGGGAVQPGNYEVTDARFQNIKTDFRPNALNLVLVLAVLNADGEPVRGADPQELNLGFGEKSLEYFHPGQGSSADDSDPEDQGTDPDAQGNTVHCVGDEAFNKSCAALVFMESLAKAGFPKAELDKCWAPTLVGLKFKFDAYTPVECNSKFGTRLNTKPLIDSKTGQPADIRYKVADKWLNPNYLSGGGKVGKGDKGDKGGSGGGAKKAADADSITREVLGIVASKKAGSPIKSVQALVGFFTNEYTKNKYPAAQLAACHALVKNEDWRIEVLSEMGADLDNGQIVFPALEDAAA